MRAYRTAIAWQKDDPAPSEQPLLNLAILLQHRNQLQEAQQLLEQAAKIRPKEPRIHENLGQVYLHTDRAADAVKEFATAVSAGARESALPLSAGPGLPSQWRRCAGEAGVCAFRGAERHACDTRSAVTQQASDELNDLLQGDAITK